jgi:hypothetical protein
MKIINLLLIFLLIALIIISFYPYTTEYFNSDNININLNYDNQIHFLPPVVYACH